MNVTELFAGSNVAYRGTDDDAPAVGTVDHTSWLSVANRKQNEWARDGKQTRASLFEIRNIGTVAVGSTSFDLDEIVLPADKVTVTVGTVVTDYTICKPQERDSFTQACYISGRDPQVLTFTDKFVSGGAGIGGTINIAAYWLPETLTSATSIVSVDDPNWLVYSLAAENAFNELTYSDKYPELVAKANNLYQQMSSNNRRGTSSNPRTVRTSVARIRG